MNAIFGPGQVAPFSSSQLPFSSQQTSSDQFTQYSSSSISQPFPPSSSQGTWQSQAPVPVTQPPIITMKSEPTETDQLSDGFSDDDDDDDPNVFRVRSPLKQPSYCTYTTEELHRAIHEANIDLNPSYQRNVVWSEAKQICLIDSIFRNFYIPPVVFAVTTEEDGSLVKVCVDGKQRLTSIQKFIDGQIPHRDSRTKKAFWYTISTQQKGNKLEVPLRWKREFASKVMTCVEYQALDEGLEREIFQRVQLGVTLTSAEKLQAVSSPWAVWLGDLQQRHVTVDGGLEEVLQWNTDRARDYQNMASVLYICEAYPEQVHPTSQKVEKFLSREDAPTQSFKDDIEALFRNLYEIATSPKLNHGFKKISARLAPVEFMFIGALLYATRDAPLEDRAAAIFNMRKHIRQEFDDIRTNSKVCRALWEFIGDIEIDASGALASPRHVRRNDTSSAGTGTKRGRTNKEDEDYSPRRPAPRGRGRGRGRYN